MGNQRSTWVPYTRPAVFRLRLASLLDGQISARGNETGYRLLRLCLAMARLRMFPWRANVRRLIWGMRAYVKKRSA